MRRMNRFRIDWLLFLAWALFINLCNLWLIGPLVQDYSILGVVALFIIAGVWFASIPPRFRKKWLTFTVYSILLGTGIDSLTFYPTGHKIAWMVIMSVAMMVAAFAYARIRLLSLTVAALGVILCNLWLPYEDWTLLSHFRILYYGKAGLNPADMPSLPMVVVPTKDGQHVLVTLSNFKESKDSVLQAVQAAGRSPNDLHNVVESLGHRYQLVEVAEQNGKFALSSVRPSDLAAMDPAALFSSSFPMRVADWTVDQGKVIQYSSASNTASELTKLTNNPADYPSNLLAASEHVMDLNLAHWSDLLKTLGVSRSQGLSVTGGMLSGTWNGHTISLPVAATEVVATGSFTSAHASEALLEGANRLQIVNLTDGTGALVSTYVGSVNSALTDDIRVGPVDATGQDMIFVNGSPAFILRASATGAWQDIYTAPPQSSLRFEGSVAFGQDKTPEILTDDPSLMRATSIRFLTSYTLRDGQLVRNWRVYHTNLVNVYPVQFTPSGPTDLVLSVYNQGKFFVLSRHFIPVVPLTSGLLGLSVAIGFVIRLRKGERRHATTRA